MTPNTLFVIIFAVIIVIGIISALMANDQVNYGSKQTCNHKWKCIHQIEHKIYDEPWHKYPSERYMEKIWECESCKEIKRTRHPL